MTNDIPEEKEKPGPGFVENKKLIAAGIVVALVIIAVIAVVLVQMPSDNGNKKSATVTNPAHQKTTVSSSGTPKITETISLIHTQQIVQTPTTTATPALPVDFILQSGTPASCGLTCRQMDASVTNTGFATAHNVCIEVSMHNSKNEIINLNGAPSIQQCVGDLSGGQSKTEPITVNADCGAFASKCIGETLTLKTKITSEEKTVQFPDQLIAV